MRVNASSKDTAVGGSSTFVTETDSDLLADGFSVTRTVTSSRESPSRSSAAPAFRYSAVCAAFNSNCAAFAPVNSRPCEPPSASVTPTSATLMRELVSRSSAMLVNGLPKDTAVAGSSTFVTVTRNDAVAAGFPEARTATSRCRLVSQSSAVPARRYSAVCAAFRTNRSASAPINSRLRGPTSASVTPTFATRMLELVSRSSARLLTWPLKVTAVGAASTGAAVVERATETMPSSVTLHGLPPFD